jgi:hypothetical protein
VDGNVLLAGISHSESHKTRYDSLLAIVGSFDLQRST